MGNRFFSRSTFRGHLYLLTTMMLVPAFVGIYWLSFWLRFERRLSGENLACFTATVGWIVAVKLGWFAGLRLPGVEPFGDVLRSDGPAAGGNGRPDDDDDDPVSGHPSADDSPQRVPVGLGYDRRGAGRRPLADAGSAGNALVAFLPPNQVRVLIAGVGDMGVSTLRMIRRLGQPRYRVVGFLGGTSAHVGTRLDGLPVIAACEQAGRVVARYAVRQILVTQGDLSGRALRKLVDDVSGSGCEVRVLPNYRQLIEGNVTFQPRAVSIEDLLQREPVQLAIDGIRQWIDGRVILVTGSAGSIGSEICRQLLQFAPERIVAVDRAETAQFFLERELRALPGGDCIDFCIADVLDELRMRQLFMRHRPHVVFHAAAYKHVPLMERHPQEAVRNIVTATRQLADVSKDLRIDSFVMISTDKAVNPTSLMGACKRVAELYVQSLAGCCSTRFVTVRFGNVLDSAGSVVQLFRQQIAAGGPVTVTHPEMRRFFMTIPEASQLVIQAGAIGQSGQILLLDMGEPVRIVDLAADMIRLSGLRVGDDIAIQFTGIRPGEKLYEELHMPGERLLPTCHPKIIVADHQPPLVHDVGIAVAELESLGRQVPQAITGRLQEIIAGYGRSERHPAAAQFVAA